MLNTSGVPAPSHFFTIVIIIVVPKGLIEQIIRAMFLLPPSFVFCLSRLAREVIARSFVEGPYSAKA